MRGKPRGVLALSGVLASLIASTAVGQGVEQLISIGETRAEEGRQAQAQIDALAEETRELFYEHQLLVKEIEGLVVHNELVQAWVDTQERELAELRESIDQVTMIERSVVPLMTRMIDGLEKFIELDLPFRLEERRERVAELRGLLTQSDVSAAEQFRFVMQAWQIENDYGRFADTYTGELVLDNIRREVDFFMLGRIALYFVTPDNGIAGVWDRDTNDWMTLTGADAQEIRDGITVIQTNSPELLMLPIAPPQEN